MKTKVYCWNCNTEMTLTCEKGCCYVCPKCKSHSPKWSVSYCDKRKTCKGCSAYNYCYAEIKKIKDKKWKRGKK